MKSILVLIVLMFSFSVFAEGDGKGDKWKERRDKRVAQMTEKVAMVQKNIDCFKAASTKDAFKACKKSAKQSREAFKAKHPRKNKK